ncbi:MAG: mevalonate kinase [Myxococcales bacterium]|nr:mevalonate kinase [Myxococcales bacterium]
MSVSSTSTTHSSAPDGATAGIDPVRGTAHGKVILFGEHAVVYGVPALAVGIDRGAWAQVSTGADATLDAPAVSVLHVRGWNVTVREDEGDDGPPLARAFRDVLAATRNDQRAAGRTPVGTVHVEAEADLPPGGGLGCSAALGVAVARAIDAAASAESIAARVDAWERVFHGNPSGIDAAVASAGGCVLFTRGTGDEPATIERVRVSETLHLCIGHSGQASSTKSMVDSVARIRERRPEVTQKTFDAIHTLVKNARLAIVDHDLRAIGQLLDLNQMLLSGLFLSTPEIEQMCATARTAGALGAKLTGAGGGGCVVALVTDAARGADVLAAWKAEGFDGFAASVKAEVQDVREILQKLHERVVAAGSP